MDDRERGLVRRLDELQLELFDHQGEEIEALGGPTPSVEPSRDHLRRTSWHSGAMKARRRLYP